MKTLLPLMGIVSVGNYLEPFGEDSRFCAQVIGLAELNENHRAVAARMQMSLLAVPPEFPAVRSHVIRMRIDVEMRGIYALCKAQLVFPIDDPPFKSSFDEMHGWVSNVLKEHYMSANGTTLNFCGMVGSTGLTTAGIDSQRPPTYESDFYIDSVHRMRRDYLKSL